MKASGPPVFAMTMMALGILGLMKGGFTPMWAGVPRGMPGRDGLLLPDDEHDGFYYALLQKE